MSEAYELEHLVTLEETNLMGNVYFVNYLRWQGKSRERFLHDHAPGVIAALVDDLVLVTTRCSCEYFAQLLAFDRVRVRMTLGELRPHRVLMRFDYLRGDELVARGEQEIACMTPADGALRPVPVPQELVDALARYRARA